MENIIDSICILIKEGTDCKSIEKEVFAFACKIASGLFSQIISVIDD